MQTMKKRLKFRDDGTFVIVQFSDVEFLDEFDYDPETPKYDSETRAATTLQSAIG